MVPQYESETNGKFQEQNGLKGVQIVQFECPRHSHPSVSSISGIWHFSCRYLRSGPCFIPNSCVSGNSKLIIFFYQNVFPHVLLTCPAWASPGSATPCAATPRATSGTSPCPRWDSFSWAKNWLYEVRSSVPEVDDDSHVCDVGLVDDADELDDNFDPSELHFILRK